MLWRVRKSTGVVQTGGAENSVLPGNTGATGLNVAEKKGCVKTKRDLDRKYCTVLQNNDVETAQNMVYKAKKDKNMSAAEAREYAALLKVRRLYEDGLEKLHEGEYAPAGVERNARYKIDENLKHQFDDWLSGKMPYNGVFDLGQTPEILKRYGAQDLPLSMTQQVMSKITGMKHSIALDELAKLPDQIANPIMLFKGSVPDSFTVITEITDKSGNDVLAAIHLNKKQGRLYVNNVASVCGKENMINYVQKNIDNQNLLFADTKKAPMWFTTRGLQLPKVVQTNIAANNNIPNPAENVNSKSQKNKKRFALDEKTETPEFKRWFGNSKVVDENGKPKVMYHGSREKFTAMDKEKGGLLYFADKKYIAVGYATGSGGAEVYSVQATAIADGYVNLTLPYVVRAFANCGSLPTNLPLNVQLRLDTTAVTAGTGNLIVEKMC